MITISLYLLDRRINEFAPRTYVSGKITFLILAKLDFQVKWVCARFLLMRLHFQECLEFKWEFRSWLI